MGLFDTLFGKKPQVIKSNGYFKMLDGYTPMYTNYHGGIYEMLQTKAIINTIATDCGKSVPELAKHNARIDYMLKHKPNPFMTTSDFIERVVTNYLCDNNSFIVPMLDRFGKVVGLFPIQYNSTECIDVNGKLYLKYRFIDNQEYAIEYSKVGHLRRMQYKNDMFGDSNSALNQTIELLHAQNESVTDALKHSGVIRFMGQLNTQLLAKKHFEEERDMFSSLNFGSNNNQMMIYDSRYKDIKQVESKPVYLDEKQQALIDENIRKYFGVSSNVVEHKFANDYEWNSYYEGVIEPILIKLGEALTGMIYTVNQVQNGDAVYMTTNRLQYMDNNTKLNYVTQLRDRGVINGNQVCDILNLPHYEGGDKYYIRKEYAEISELDHESEDELDTVETQPVVESEVDENA